MTDIETGLHAGRIPYARAGGRGKPLVILNGGQGFMRKLTPARMVRDARRIARLLPSGQAFILVQYDPKPAGKLDLALLADSVNELVRTLAEQPVTVIGISFGGMVALRLAARHRESVARLVLLSSAHRFSEAGQSRLRQQAAWVMQGELARVLMDYTDIFRRPWWNWLIRLRFRAERGRIAGTMGDPEAITAYLLAAVDPTPVRLEALDLPVLIVGGDADQYFAGAMEEAATAIPGARLCLLPGETHMVAVERTKAVARILEPFIRGS